MGLFTGLYLSIIILLSGLSIYLGDRLSFYLILSLPFFLYLHSFVKKEKLIFPRELTVLWIGFSIFDLVSTVLSFDHELSIERFLLYQSGFLTLVYFYNKKDFLRPYVEKTIVGSALVFTVAFIFKDTLMDYVRIIDVNQLFNFFFPLIKGNNHLGIWLGMTILILLSNRNFLLMSIFIPFFVFAYSRSAYLGVFVAGLALLSDRLQGLFNNKRRVVLYGLFTLATIVFIFGVAILVPRNDFLSDRPDFYKEAIMGFNDKPLFGYGSGNFTHISRKYVAVSNGVFASNSHNMFLDILSGSGIFAFVFFCLFIVSILKSARNNRNFAVFVFLLTVATASYIFVMPTFMLLFFIYAGLTHKTDSFIKVDILNKFMVTVVFVVAIYIAYSEALYLKGAFAKSLSLYPFRKDAHESMIMQSHLLDKNAKYEGLESYKKYFPENFEQLNFSANVYKRMGDSKKALNDFMAIYENGSGFGPKIVRQINSQYILIGDPISGYYFAKNFINTVLSDHNKYGHMVNDTYDLCIYVNKHYLDKAVCF